LPNFQERADALGLKNVPSSEDKKAEVEGIGDSAS